MEISYGLKKNLFLDATERLNKPSFIKAPVIRLLGTFITPSGKITVNVNDINSDGSILTTGYLECPGNDEKPYVFFFRLYAPNVLIKYHFSDKSYTNYYFYFCLNGLLRNTLEKYAYVEQEFDQDFKRRITNMRSTCNTWSLCTRNTGKAALFVDTVTIIHHNRRYLAFGNAW